MPAPPYFSGKITPRKPISASLGITSEGNCEASSHSITCGAISASANSRTARRRCCCSSVNENSTTYLYHGVMGGAGMNAKYEPATIGLGVLQNQRGDACAAAHGAED